MTAGLPKVVSDTATATVGNIDLLTTEELSALLGVPKSTLDNWRTVKNKGPKFVKFGRHVRYQRKAVEDWLNGLER